MKKENQICSDCGELPAIIASVKAFSNNYYRLSNGTIFGKGMEKMRPNAEILYLCEPCFNELLKKERVDPIANFYILTGHRKKKMKDAAKPHNHNEK